jgi:hypothetical protein
VEFAAKAVRVIVDPGNCGFLCSIVAMRRAGKSVEISMQSECSQVQRLANLVGVVALNELFLPAARNQVFGFAATAGCHTSCLVPLGLIKAAEVSLGLALPQDATLRFVSSLESESQKENESQNNAKEI